MASRERLASGRVTDTARRPPAAPQAPRTESAPALASAPPIPWEALYGNASPALQRELISLARQQGLLYAHQLPPERNGGATDADAARAVLTSLLSGQTREIEPSRPDVLAVRDEALDAGQREAVARALATPDVCLVRGLPGTGKTRVVAEIIAQAAARGERVLLLAVTPAAIDGALERVGAVEGLCALRCLGPDERPDNLPPAGRAALFGERLHHVSADALQAARQGLASHEDRWRRLRQDEAIWAKLQDLADRLGQIQDRRDTLTGQLDRSAEEVASEAAAIEAGKGTGGRFPEAVRAALRARHETQATIDQSLATARSKLDENGQERAALQIRIESIRPLAEAKQTRRWWTKAWWQAFSRKTVVADLAALEEQLRHVESARAELDADVGRLTRERDEAAEAFQAQCQQLQAGETAERRTALANQLAALDQEAVQVRDKGRAAGQGLSGDGPRPEAPCRATVEEGRAAWAAQVRQAEQGRDFSRRWLAYLEEAPPWPGLLPASANLVAATLTALPADVHFGNGAACGRGFDLLIFQEADRITEAEFFQVASRARRWVLVGEPSFDPAAPTERSYSLRKPQPPALKAGFFDKLWRHLHWEPRDLPYSWIREGDRLCCRLRTVPADGRQFLEVEGVSDHPDIELRILTLPQSGPVLAEVVFPPTMLVAEAKAFIYKELEELAVQTSGSSVRWVEEPQRLLFRLAEEIIPATEVVDLEAGVRELVGLPRSERNGTNDGPWLTYRLEFDRAAGWDRTRAEEWVQHYLGGRDLGRTARLDVPHRMHPDLAVFLSHLLFAGEYRVSGRAAAPNNGCPCRVEFVPVPPLRERGSQSLRGSLSRKGGAGLEVDLSDPRHRSRLPADPDVELPAQGFVNYPEAQAVVRTLEALAAGPTDWLAGDATAATRPVVAALAPYAAQVAVIRTLVRRSTQLANAPFEVVVDLPAAFRERECAAVLLSLTRSHSHRPVTYGEGPELLELALTRARFQLILFGDSGALARRSVWEGPVEHLGDLAAARERELAAQLVHSLEGQGGPPGLLHVREGASP